MKKSVVFSIAIIYIVAIILVGFLGLKMRVYDEKIYVDSIICETDGYQAFEPGKEVDGCNGFISLIYSKDLKVTLVCSVKPDNATYRALDYLYDTTQSVFTLVKNKDGSATITFNDEGSAVVSVRSTDGKNTTLKIRIDAIEIQEVKI